MSPLPIARFFALTGTIYGLGAKLAVNDIAIADQFAREMYDQAKINREELAYLFGKEVIKYIIDYCENNPPISRQVF